MMFSFSKLLLLAVVVLAVLYGWRWVTRVNQIRAEARRDAAVQARKQRPAVAQDMVRCPRCGVFVAADASSCGRPDCPYR